MGIKRETAMPNYEGAWYPEEGVKDPNKSLAYISEYFPGILSGPNSIGLELKNNSNLQILPAQKLGLFDRFIAEAGVHRLRYYHREHLGTRGWALQYIKGQKSQVSRTEFFLSWGGMIGYESSGVYGNFVDQIDFKYDNLDRVIRVGSKAGGTWEFEMNINSPDLASGLHEVTEKSRQESLRTIRDSQHSAEAKKRLVRINNAFTRGENILVLDVEDTRGEGQIAIPASIKPTRFI